MNVTMRRMTVDDIDAVYAIETKAHIAPWTKQVLMDCVFVNYDCFVLELQEQQVNTIAAYLIARHAEDKIHILNLCVAQELQSQGNGRTLLTQYIHSVSHYANVSAITLEVRTSNKIAIQLYASLGFVQTSVKPAYYVDVNGREDAIVLEKKLRCG